MSDKIRCGLCEGWGVTSYDAEGIPNACERCKGLGEVDKPPAPVYEKPDVTKNSWWSGTTFGSVRAKALSEIPCGRTVGHGTSCSEGYLCSSCKTTKELCEAVVEAYDAGYGDGYGG